MTMQHATSYQHCHDHAREKADALADAITTEAERIVRDKEALRDVVSGWLIDADTDIAELLALIVMSRLKQPAAGSLMLGAAEGLESALRQLETNIAAEVDKEARFNIEGDKP
jgi:hypothetical protein